MIRKNLRQIALALLTLMIPFTMNCYGRFPLTKAVYQFNGRVGRSIGETEPSREIGPHVVFWVFVILPVYGIAMLGDALIFNLFEFWTGEKLDVAMQSEHNGVKVDLASSKDGHELVMTLSRDGKVLSQEHFVKTGDGTFDVRRADGRLAGQVLKTPTGDIRLMDANGNQVSLVSAGELGAIH
jgi:hypothetical protein